MAKIIITIPRDPKQGTTIKVEGHPGPGCKSLTEKLEQALGRVVSDVETDEYHQAEIQQDQQQQQIQ